MAILAINFRATAGYVEDGAGETYCIGDTYPTTRGGITFGWVSGLSGSRDRSTAYDVRLAGVNYRINDGTQATFRLDLPNTGLASIRLAIGDAANAQLDQYIKLLDTSSVIATIDDEGGTAVANFDDAEGTNHIAANWPGSNVAIPYEFTSTILNLVCGTPTAETDATTIAHLYVDIAAAGASSTPVIMYHYKKRRSM